MSMRKTKIIETVSGREDAKELLLDMNPCVIKDGKLKGNITYYDRLELRGVGKRRKEDSPTRFFGDDLRYIVYGANNYWLFSEIFGERKLIHIYQDEAIDAILMSIDSVNLDLCHKIALERNEVFNECRSKIKTKNNPAKNEPFEIINSKKAHLLIQCIDLDNDDGFCRVGDYMYSHKDSTKGWYAITRKIEKAYGNYIIGNDMYDYDSLVDFLVGAIILTEHNVITRSCYYLENARIISGDTSAAIMALRGK